MNEQSRINAMIAYLFLGPLFLLVRSGTPIGEPYVRAHAKRASIIMVIALSIILIYSFLLSPLFTFQIFGISLNSVILTVFMIVLSGILVHGAYRAYHGIDARVMHSISLDTSTERIEGAYSEEEKVRIIASFIPFVGIYIAHQYSREPYTIGRKVGNMIAFILITLIVFYGGSVSTLVFAVTIASIVLWIVTFVYLFFYNQFFSLGAYRYIPTYASIEAHIVASVMSVYDFFRVAFGGAKSTTYTDIYTTRKELYSESVIPEVPYILPVWIVALPGINLLTLPSLTMAGVRSYRPLILQGLMITLALALIMWLYGPQSPMALYLLFPIITLLVSASTNLSTRAPLTSPVVSLIALFSKSKEIIQTAQEQKEEVSFTYEEEKK